LGRLPSVEFPRSRSKWPPKRVRLQATLSYPVLVTPE